MLVDVHGDEAISNNFIACAEGIPSWTERMAACKTKFSEFLAVASPEFQTVRPCLFLANPIDDVPPSKASRRSISCPEP